MAHVVGLFIGNDELFGTFGLWAFLSVGAVALFAVFLPLVSWIDGRRKEREAYYKSEMMRRIAESTADGAKTALELLREDNRQREIKRFEGMKMGGVINVCVGIGLLIFFRSLMGAEKESPWLVGLIPGMVGVGMLVYVFFMAKPVE
jgi:hypothetical protein